jgi:hypothetical protein
LPSNVIFGGVFAGTACTSTSDPTSVIAGPYCAFCGIFGNTGELRAAVLAAQAVGADCAATVYQTYGPMNAWDVSRITDLSYLFADINGPSFCTTAGLNLNNWDVSQVTSMTGMSQDSIPSHIAVLAIVPNIVFESFSGLFYSSDAGFQPVINEWDTSAVTRMNMMVRYKFRTFLCGHDTTC